MSFHDEFVKSCRGDVICQTLWLSFRPEALLIMRTLRDMNMSKLVSEDVALFYSLLVDLFPNVKAEHTPSNAIENALMQVMHECNGACIVSQKYTLLTSIMCIGQVCTERQLQPQDSWLKKCVQFHETCSVRHGIMVVGPTGSGERSLPLCTWHAMHLGCICSVVWTTWVHTSRSVHHRKVDNH